MKIHEYQAKEILSHYEIPVTKEVLCYTVSEVQTAAEQLGFPVVVKAQVLTGGRGKAGGVKLVRNADKSIDWVPQFVDDDSGVGTQILATDVNSDGLPDIVVGNKKGTFVHLHETKKVSKDEWEKAQPKVVFPK